MDIRWLNVIGLGLDLVGACVLAWGLMISKADALRLGSSYWGGGTDEDEIDEEDLDLPPVQDRLAQSRNAKIGLGFLVCGFLLQIVGNWPR